MQVKMIKNAEYYVFLLADGGSTQMPFSPPVGIKQWQCAACGHTTEVIQAFATAVAAAEAAAALLGCDGMRIGFGSNGRGSEWFELVGEIHRELNNILSPKRILLT